MTETMIGKAYVQIVPSTKGMSDAISSEMGSAGEKSGKSFNLSFGKILGATAMIGAAKKGVELTTDFIKGAIDGFGNYEQLSGGIETLYGDTADQVMENAARAFQTAGLSANEYMETVTGFAASLTSSLGEYSWEAAGYADMAITDMSDNANKMGSSMESIQNAYQGFAKQNYTMLDNLKLGYGGTKEEMERLLRDAEELEGYDVGALDISNFADIVEAIHIVQENLGITGTTAEEASTTIQGSLGQMKAAWDNLVVGMASGDTDLSGLIGNFMDSIQTFAGNVMPVVETALNSLVQVIGEVGPEVVTFFVEAITNNLPQLVVAAVQIILALAVALLNAIPQLIAAIPQIMTALKDAFIAAAPQLKEAAIKLIESLKTALVTAWNAITTLAGQLIAKLKAAFIAKVNQFKEIGKNIVNGIKEGILNAWDSLTSWVKNMCSELVGSVKDFFKIGSPSRVFADEVGKWIPAGIASGIENGMGVLNDAMSSMSDELVMDAVNANATITSSAANYGSGYSETGSSVADLLATYLPIIASGENVNITLEGDAKALFKSVQSSNRVFTRTTGVSAFA